MEQSDPFDGMLAADREAPIGPRAGRALDALAREVAAAPSTVPDSDQPMHITAQAVREENAIAATIGADVASKFGAVVRETNVRRKQVDSVERINEELGAVRMLNYINGRVLRVEGALDLGAFHHIVTEAMEKHALIARGEVTL